MGLGLWMDPKETLVVLLCKHMVFSFEPSGDNLGDHF
jgi:hypothetical protein